ncbi:MAG: ATP-binding protein [Magnetococcus sp. WYHC-3]
MNIMVTLRSLPNLLLPRQIPWAGWLFLTLLVAVSYGYRQNVNDAHVRQLAIDNARAHFAKDLAFRHWATRHGGVYVPTDARTPPSPYLAHLPERDITTPSGVKLTLMNPAYMLRQLMQEYPGMYGARGRITSLQYLNPINAPDDWEQTALKDFEHGVEEKLEFIQLHGEPQLRLMRPMYVVPGCLKCHGHQNYHVGDVRGGVGVLIPMQPYLDARAQLDRGNLVFHLMFWAGGLVVVGGWRRAMEQRESENLRARRALQESEERFRILARASPVGVFFTDPGGKCQFANEKWADLTRRPPETFIGQGLPQVVHPRDRANVARSWEETITRGIPSRHEFQLEVPENAEGPWVLAETLPLTDSEGQITGHVGILTDISHRVAWEEQLRLSKEKAEQATRAKSDFLAAMSHEIRTPMNSVLGMAELLSEQIQVPEQRLMVEVLERNGRSLLALINDILDLSRIESGHITLHPEPFDLAELIADVMAIMGAIDREKSLERQQQVHLPHGTLRQGDPSRLRQILLNLLGNAIKFTLHGHVTLRVSESPQPTDGARVSFVVEDSGIGIPHEVQQTIFLPFTQGDNSVRRRFGGSGLGLAICRRLALLMGGDISVHSIPGQGSVFQVDINLPALGDHAAIPSPQEPSVAATTPGAATVLAGRSVLLVEDSADNVTLMRAYLKQTGVLLTVAGNGREAVQAVQQQPFDLIFMDIQMPGMDGLEATRIIRAWETEQGRRPVPILALTAHALTGDMEQSLAAGCDAHLVKPISKRTLLRSMEQHLGRPSTAPVQSESG